MSNVHNVHNVHNTSNNASNRDYRDLQNLIAILGILNSVHNKDTSTDEPLLFYHGTVDKYVPDILKNGLRPVTGNRWNVIRGGKYIPARDDDPGYVYFSPYKETAEDFAKLRVRYLQTPVNHLFTGRGIGFTTLRLKKLPGAPVIHDAKPVIIKITAPRDKYAGKFEYDPNMGFTGWRYKGIIPVEYLEVAR